MAHGHEIDWTGGKNERGVEVNRNLSTAKELRRAYQSSSIAQSRKHATKQLLGGSFVVRSYNAGIAMLLQLLHECLTFFVCIASLHYLC